MPGSHHDRGTSVRGMKTRFRSGPTRTGRNGRRLLVAAVTCKKDCAKKTYDSVIHSGSQHTAGPVVLPEHEVDDSEQTESCDSGDQEIRAHGGEYRGCVVLGRRTGK